MRRMLFKSLVHGPLTEAAPKADDAALAELAAQVDRTARLRRRCFCRSSGRSAHSRLPALADHVTSRAACIAGNSGTECEIDPQRMDFIAPTEFTALRDFRIRPRTYAFHRRACCRGPSWASSLDPPSPWC